MKQTKNFLIPVNLFKKKTDSSAKISEIERKIPSISDLVTTSALTVVENRHLMLVAQLKEQVIMPK